MARFSEQLQRGLLLRCPNCGRGKVFSGLFRSNKQCSVCHFTFEREEGYFSSAMAINLIISELIVAAVIIPLAANPGLPLWTVLLWCAPLPILLPLLFYHHSRTLWMSMDHYVRPHRGGLLAAPPNSQRSDPTMTGKTLDEF